MSVDTVSAARSVNKRGAGSPRAGAPVPGWWDYLGPIGAVKIAALAGLFVWLYWAQVYRMVSYWQEPDWSHGYLIPLFCLYIVNGRRSELISGDHRGSLAGLALMLLSLFVYIMSIKLQIGPTAPLSMISMIAALVLLLRGWRTLWLTLFPIVFILLAVPPPERLYRAFTQPLQQFAAVISAFVLNMMPRVEVENQGFNINWTSTTGPASGSFAVAGACSGMRSLMAFIALGLAMAYFNPRATWQRIVVVIVVIPVALFCNVLRVIITGCFQMYGHPELATGTPHTVVGLCTFGIGFALYLGILWILDHLFVEEEDEPPAAMEGEKA